MTLEGVADLLLSNIPDLTLLAFTVRRTRTTYPNQLVLSSSCKILAVRTKADAADVKIAVEIKAIVLKNANLLARVDIIDLGRPITAGCHIFTISAEPDTADNALVLQGVHQIDVENAGDRLIEHRPPIILDLLDVARETLRVDL